MHLLRKHRRLMGFSLALAVILLSGSASVHAGVEEVTAKNLKQKIASAKTAEDHKALAGYYRAEAEKAQGKATEHAEMAEAYRKAGFGAAAKTPRAPGTIEHCNYLVKTYKTLADSLAKLAKEHEAMAAQVK